MKQTDQALIVVDYQNGFIPESENGTGELWVEGGWLLAPRINELMNETKTKWWLIIATRDWHPRWHMSFASNYEGKNPFETVTYEEAVNGIPANITLKDTAEFSHQDLEIEMWAVGSQMLWPDHCIAGTPSAEYHKDLDTSLVDHHIIKWYRAETEMYSGFQGKEDIEPGKIMSDILREAGVRTVKVVWLATDYCVQSTAVDAVKNWFKAIIDRSAIAGVAITSPEDTVRYLEELREKQNVDFV